MKKLHAAFTLIELLVVISIIAILAGLAMPVFSSAIERGRATEDKNNLISIGKGIIMFLNDNDDSMFNKSDTGANSWPDLLHAKYVKDWKAFHSPFDKRPKTDTEPVSISYGLNENVLGTDDPPATNPRFVGKWVNSASSVILAAPMVTQVKGAVAFDTKAISGTVVKVKAGQAGDFGTHQSRKVLNVLFADAHVEQMEWDKFCGTAPKQDKKLWTRWWHPLDDGTGQ